MKRVIYRKGGIVRKCDACGKTYVDSKDVFCPHCGAIGQKQCTHNSSFDSDRWNRGEIYGNGSNTYQQGAEPHAQRVGNAYNNRAEKSREVKKQYGEDYKSPKSTVATILDTVTKKAKETKGNEKSISKIIGAVVALIAAVNVLIPAVSEIDLSGNVTDVFYEEESVEYINGTGEYPVDVIAGGVAIEPFEDWDGTWFFDMYIESLYMSSDESKMSFEVCDKLSGDGYIHLDGFFYTMPDKIMSYDKFDEILFEEGSYVISDAHSVDSHTVQYWFTAGDIVYFDYLTVIFDDGSSVGLTLPFNAFSCDEDGNVVYYTCNINEEENRVSFEEIAPVMYPVAYDCVVEF